MGVIKTFINCMFGPRLYRVYKITLSGRPIEHKTYIPSNSERWGDRVVVSFATIWSISLYVIPLVATFMYHHSYSIIDNVYFLSKIAVGAGFIVITSLVMRGHARYSDDVYYKFIRELDHARKHANRATKDGLRQYDYDFWAVPVDYGTKKVSLQPKMSLRNVGGETINSEIHSSLSYLVELPYKLLAYIAARTFAVKLIYPGSVSIVNWALRSTLEKGRIDLMTQGGVRFKLRTPDLNFIDTMFIDRRNVTPAGNVLVICCEGNCGFYENGIVVTPLKKGYSILGWNHPGFGDSTGTPYPDQEEYAMDTVMRFAIDHLGFEEENIIIYGWSIGGYTACFAATNYPNINSLILDATFDHVLPLAYMAVPSYLQRLTRRIILYHFHLCVADYLLSYNGPVLIVRRTEDEIVCTPSNTMCGNRANVLLLRLLINRYPHLFSEESRSTSLLLKILSAEPADKKKILNLITRHVPECIDIIGREIQSNGGVVTFPSELGKGIHINTKHGLILYLITKYLKDQQSSHCVPLSENLFVPAWNPKSVYDTFLQSIAEQEATEEEYQTQLIAEASEPSQSTFAYTSNVKPNAKKSKANTKRLQARKARIEATGTADASTLEANPFAEGSLEATTIEAMALRAIARRTRSRVPGALAASDQDASSEDSLDVHESDLEAIDLAFPDSETSDEEATAEKATAEEKKAEKANVADAIAPDTNTGKVNAQEEIPGRRSP